MLWNELSCLPVQLGKVRDRTFFGQRRTMMAACFSNFSNFRSNGYHNTLLLDPVSREHITYPMLHYNYIPMIVALMLNKSFIGAFTISIKNIFIIHIDASFASLWTETSLSEG